MASVKATLTSYDDKGRRLKSRKLNAWTCEAEKPACIDIALGDGTDIIIPVKELIKSLKKAELI